MRAVQAVFGRGADVAARLLDRRAEGLEALDVLVDGADAEVAAAGHGDLRAAEAAELRADEVRRSADAPHKLLRGDRIADVAAIDLHHRRAEAADARTHAVQDVQQQVHVGNIRQVFDPARAAHEQRSR